MNEKPAESPGGEAASARELRREDKIRQIVRAATEVFLEDGFAAASMDKIVQKAGVSKRTIYNYYESKDEIFVDVMQTQLGGLYRNFEIDLGGSEDLAEQLRHVGVDMLRIANSQETLSLFRITAAEAQRYPKLAQQFFEESFENVILGIAALLDREIVRSGIRMTGTKEAGEYFLDLLFGTGFHRVVFGTQPPMDERTIAARTERALNYFFRTYPALNPGN